MIKVGHLKSKYKPKWDAMFVSSIAKIKKKNVFNDNTQCWQEYSATDTFTYSS